MTKTATLVYISMLTAIQCVLAQIAIPLPISPVPINLVLISVYVCGLLLPAGKGFMCQLLYIFLGAIGIPAFAFFSSGLGVLFGATGGFVFSFPFVSVVISFLSNNISSEYRYIISLIVGLLICYTIGTLWFSYVSGVTLIEGVIFCVLPFVIGDLFKIGIVLLLINAIKRH